MKKNILIIAPHPDDEVLGCGATIKKHAGRGDDVFVLILTNGWMADGDETAKTLRENAEKCGEMLGVKKIYFADLPDQKLDGLPLLDIVREIDPVIEETKPEIIYTTHRGDLNQDHRAVFEATMIAARPINKYVKEIYSYEVLSSTEWAAPSQENIFIPTVFVNTEKEIEDKIKAFNVYGSEVKKWPHSRSEEGIRTLAKYRGMQSNMPFAEAFVLIRKTGIL